MATVNYPDMIRELLDKAAVQMDKVLAVWNFLPPADAPTINMVQFADALEVVGDELMMLKETLSKAVADAYKTN